MPKLRKTPEETMNLELLGTINKQMTILEYAPEHMSGWLKCSINTWYTRKKKPEGMTLGELRVICDKLKLTDRELCAAVGVNYKGTSQ